MKPGDFEVDKNGNVITRPLMGWLAAPAAGIAVILAVHYAESDADIENHTPKSLQLILTPHQCLELAELLTRQANNLITARPSGKSPN